MKSASLGIAVKILTGFSTSVESAAMGTTVPVQNQFVTNMAYAKKDN